MKKDIYKKILNDRVANIRFTLDDLRQRLGNGEISFPEFLYIEGNLYNDLIITQRELIELEREAVHV